MQVFVVHAIFVLQNHFAWLYDGEALLKSHPKEKAMVHNPAMPPLSVGVEEAARMIGVTRTKLYEMLAQNDLVSFKLGRRRLIAVKDLEAFVSRQAKLNSR